MRGTRALLLLHWISLDAVAVMLAYQWALARWVGAQPPASAGLFLGLGIWLGYTADRLLDLQRTPDLALVSPRHAFLAANRPVVTRAWLAIAASAGLLAPVLLPTRHLVAGAAFVLLAAVYLGFVTGTGPSPSPAPRSSPHPAPAPRRWPADAKGAATTALLTLAGAWWFVGSPGQFRASGGSVMVLFAGAALLNLGVLRHASRSAGGTRLSVGRDELSLLVDGAVLVAMLVVGALAP